MNKTKNAITILTFLLSLVVVGQNQNRAITIHDIQFTEDPYGESPYTDETVTVTGIVTSSDQQFDLGFIFIQDEGGGPWSGIWVRGSEATNLFRGEEVTVIGTVREDFGMTVLDASSVELTGKLKEIVVTDMDPTDSTSHIGNGWEKWESVLIQYKNPDGDKLYISHPKPDGNNDYGDYAVSPMTRLAPKKLGRILAGRVTSSLISSLYVSIVSDLAWYDNSGQMQVDPIEASTEMEMDGVIGQMVYGFSDYRLLPRNNDDFIGINVELAPTTLPGSPLDIDEFETVNFKIYPNPTADFVHIMCDSKGFTEVKIFDLSGKLMLSHNLTGSQMLVDISNLLSGNYIVQLKTEKDKFVSSSLVVQR